MDDFGRVLWKGFRLKEFQELPPEEKEKFGGVSKYVV
jgi:hypothetical protein